MNVLYYLGTFPKLSESFILNEIYELERRGHNVAVCALNRPDTRIAHDEFAELDIPIKYVETPGITNAPELLSAKTLHPRVLMNAGYRASPLHHAANLFRAKRCAEFVKGLDWDINHVHTHFAEISKFGARYVASYLGVPFTLTTHAYDLYREPVGSYTSALLRNADRIVTISEHNKQYMREQFVKNIPIDVVHAGIRPEKFAPTDVTVDNRILTVSRFVEKKGLLYAIEAVAKVVKHVPDLEYHIVGSGPLEGDLRRKVDELELSGNVAFLENIDDQRLLAEFDEARCFLLPCVIAESGDRDGIPVVLMEAMAMETPPISTTVSGIPELIEHETNGLLVEPRNSDAVASAVLEMFQDDVHWSNYCPNARLKVVSDFDVTKEVESLEATFEAARSAR